MAKYEQGDIKLLAAIVQSNLPLNQTTSKSDLPLDLLSSELMCFLTVNQVQFTGINTKGMIVKTLSPKSIQR